MKTKLTQITGLGVFLAVILIAGIAFAQDGPVSKDSEEGRGQAKDVEKYWRTGDRMRTATPLPIGTVASPKASEPVEIELSPDIVPGYAPGWDPRSRAAQPDSSLQFDINLDDPMHDLIRGWVQPQTSPPFVPPGFPTDFNNYAPFQRFTWDYPYTQYPVSTVGKLFFTQNGHNFVCSASVINKSTLATAGHCVHAGNNKTTGWSTNVLFCPSYRPVNIADPVRGCWRGVSLTTSFQWFSASNFDRDYACIVTAKSGTKIANSIGNVTGWLGRAWNWQSKQSTFAWGYPAAAPFPGDRIITDVSTEWYQLNMSNAGEPAASNHLSKYIGNDMTGGSSGGPWWLNMASRGGLYPEYPDTDGSSITDPAQGGCCPYINGVNSHKRCTQSGCPAASIFTQEMGSPQFRSSAADINESEDVFAVCFKNGGAT